LARRCEAFFPNIFVSKLRPFFQITVLAQWISRKKT
jgi:hypothetical protein